MLGLVVPIITRAITKDGNYPHMARRDAAVWERWVDKYGSAYTGVCYDVALGGLEAPDPEATPTERRTWQYQTALKIDALVIAPDRALVIEVRPWATVSAIGAAFTYTLVLDRILGGATVLTPAIVCEGIQIDVRWACAELKIQVFEV
jgi:hypothetical protein